MIYQLPATLMLNVGCHPEKNVCHTTYTIYKTSVHHNTLAENIKGNLLCGFQIYTISNKANTTFGFLRRNLNIGNKKIKETRYRILNCSIIEFSATVWGPHTSNDIKTAGKVQPRAARWVTSRHHTSCFNSITDALAWAYTPITS